MRKFASVYAIALLVLMIAGSVAVYCFAWQSGTKACIAGIAGFFCGIVLAPILHELGHAVSALCHGMELVYLKCFCFKLVRRGVRLRFSFASPFADDETQAIPKTGGNMQSRACAYTLGGLVAEGTFFLLCTVSAIALSCIGIPNYFLWGLVPYAAYLFLLNVVPLTYAGGKTDMLVYLGLLKGEIAETAMLTAMEIHGRAYAGESFAEMDEELFTAPLLLPEDEPIFAVALDLRYKYYLEKGETELAAKQLNRLAQLQEYLPQKQVEEIAAELVYFHSVCGNHEDAEACGSFCKEYLQGETAVAKRALAAYSKAFGKEEAVARLKQQAEEILSKERIRGLAKHERVLLARL